MTTISQADAAAPAVDTASPARRPGVPRPPPPATESDHPRRLGWIGTTALAMGGSNQSLFLVGAIIAAQGTAAVPLLAVGLLLSWAAAPGWTELVLMWPRRVGGIAATCAEAFRPYSPVLANLAGVCYWWGWIPTCGLTAILSSTALHDWYLPGVPVSVLATVLVLVFCAINLCGIKLVVRLAIPIAAASALLALGATLIPVLTGNVDWHQATSFSLSLPFHGAFGAVTSAMAGLYLVGFAAPAFEAATCHVGETIDPARNVPRAVLASGAMSGLYFIALPVVLLGVLGSHGLGDNLATTLGPAFAPLVAGSAKAVAAWFIVLNMFHGTMQPLAGASRTLSQLSEDGLLPRTLAWRNRFDVPWVATLLTAAISIAFLLFGDPTWVLAAANLTYLIGIGLPSLAVWLLRRNHPEMTRPYRAPRGMVTVGLLAAGVWLVATVLGFEQFGLPTVIAGLGLAYAGSLLYAWRVWRDRVAAGRARLTRSLHLKLTGAMLATVALDGAGYLLAISHAHAHPELDTVVSDIFVAVALLTIVVGLVLPGMIAHASQEVSAAVRSLSRGTVADLTRAMEALADGDFDAAHAHAEIEPLPVRTRDEVGEIASSVRLIQEEVAQAARALDGARQGLQLADARLELNLRRQAAVADLGRRALESLEIAPLLDEAVIALHRVVEPDAAFVVVRDRAEGVHRIGAQIGLDAEARLRTMPLGDGAADFLLTSRAPVTTAGADSPLAPLLGDGAASSLLMPIRAGDGPLGAIGVHCTEPRVFTREETDFLLTVGNLVAEAIQRIANVEEIRHQALHDPLTGLPNRVLLVDHLTLALAQLARDPSHLAVLFLDLDNFKLINDSRGHSVGDEVLRHVAGVIDAALRPGDTVARFGGDEFVVLCPELDSDEDALVIAERLALALGAPLTIGGIEHRMTTSIGVAVVGGAGRTAEDLFAEADAAMYEAKERGRNRIELFDDAMRARASSRLRIATELSRALERGEMRVEYQPIVTIEDAVMRGAEALVRWNHPVQGEISPAEFIPIAEQTGAILEIGAFVLREACMTAAAWSAARPGLPPTPVSVNVSLHQIRYPGFIDLVADVLRDTGLRPSGLHLEITESVLMEETEISMRTLDGLKGLGVGLVLDDFGTGYSSLAYVRRFPLDAIKIDRTFIADLEREEEGSTIIEAIVNMAAGLRLDVVAEGIETTRQALRLRELGCELAQGWLYAPALSASHVQDLIGVSLAPASA
jgi:diguanylate cyclase (GGDEF)-like protein